MLALAYYYFGTLININSHTTYFIYWIGSDNYWSINLSLFINKLIQKVWQDVFKAN